MTPRDRRVGEQLGRDESVTNRLIQQGFYWLAFHRKHELDRQLGLVES